MCSKKKAVRQAFRDSVFGRDRYRCVVCGKRATKANAEDVLDAHHITNRNEMPNGGYVKENGVTLCKGDDGKSCHEKAEMVLKGEVIVGFTPDDLYKLIGSDRDRASQESEKL